MPTSRPVELTLRHASQGGGTYRTYFVNELSFPDPRTKLLTKARHNVSDR